MTLGREPKQPAITQYQKFTNNLAEELSAFDSKEKFTKWVLEVLKISHNLSPNENLSPSLRALLEIRLRERRSESALDDIEYIYKECILDDNKKSMFRQALGDLLQDENIPEPIFDDIIYFIPRIQATELLNPLAGVVGNGSLAQKEPHLIYDTISSLKALPPSAEIYEATLTLANGINFNDSFLLEVIDILVKCDSSKTEEIVKTFKSRIKNFRKYAEDSGKLKEFNDSMKSYSWYKE